MYRCCSRRITRGRQLFSTTAISRISLPTQFWRGGTSNGLIFNKQDLPKDQSQWQPLLSCAMGSPDPYGRQLNGMGGGISSLSKICVIGESNREDADVDFTFIQLGIKNGSLDMAGNCGNMSSAVGPYAFNEDVAYLRSKFGKGTSTSTTSTARIFNTNTKKVIHSTFSVNRPAFPEKHSLFLAQGDYLIDGVPGTGSKITLSFLKPGGAKTGKTLPTGNPVDVLRISKGNFEASLVDVANPGVFVDASDLGVSPDVTPASLDEDREMMATLEELRQEGAKVMGLDPAVGSIPKIVLLFSPSPVRVGGGVDIRCQALSMGQGHKAVPLTLALNLGVASNLFGTIPSMLANVKRRPESTVIGHPSGKLEVGLKMVGEEVESAILYRTARMLMKGEVNCS